jgi:hypothetical protein
MDQEILEVLKGYTRVILADVCRQKQIDKPALSVWVRDGGEWQELSNRTVLHMWQKSGSKSLCQIMMREFFGLNAVQYQIIKRKFNNPQELSGVYANRDYTDFIIIIDIPTLLSTTNFITGAVVGSAVVGSGLYGAHKSHQSHLQRVHHHKELLDYETRLEKEERRVENLHVENSLLDAKVTSQQADKNELSRIIEDLRKKLKEFNDSYDGVNYKLCELIGGKLDSLETSIMTHIAQGRILDNISEGYIPNDAKLCGKVKAGLTKIQLIIEHSNLIAKEYRTAWAKKKRWFTPTLQKLEDGSKAYRSILTAMKRNRSRSSCLETESIKQSDFATDVKHNIAKVKANVSRVVNPNLNNELMGKILNTYKSPQESQLLEALGVYVSTETELQELITKYNTECEQVKAVNKIATAEGGKITSGSKIQKSEDEIKSEKIQNIADHEINGSETSSDAIGEFDI